MKRNSTEQTNQLLSETSQLPALRIAYKNPEVSDNKPGRVTNKARAPKAVRKPLVKEPLPLFNDYKFKARDYDPL